MMSGRVWLVRYEGERAGVARGRVEANDGVVLLNGAAWKATIVDQPGPDAVPPGWVHMQLWPIDLHAIDPTTALRELPRPDRVLPG